MESSNKELPPLEVLTLLPLVDAGLELVALLGDLEDAVEPLWLRAAEGFEVEVGFEGGVVTGVTSTVFDWLEVAFAAGLEPTGNEDAFTEVLPEELEEEDFAMAKKFQERRK